MKAILVSIIITLLICSSNVLFGQSSQSNSSKIDYLKIALKQATHDTTRLYILDKLIIIERNSKLQEDYNNQLETIANKALNSNSTISIKNICKKFLADAIYRKGLICLNLNDYTKALEYYNRSLKIREEIGDKNGISLSYNSIGLIYSDQGDRSKAIQYHNKSLKISTELGNKFEMSTSLNNLGVIYYNQGDIPKALEYHNKSLKNREEINDKDGISNSLHAIGNIYKNL